MTRPFEAPGEAHARVGACDFVVELEGRSLRADVEGRWLSARLDGRLYRRVLDGSVVGYVLRRRPEVVPDAAGVHARVAAMAAELGAQLAGGRGSLRVRGPGGREALLAALRRVAGWTPERLDTYAGELAAVYAEPIEVLPPDRCQDLVLLPATGCPNARCSFCAFYRGRPLRVRSEAELREHISAVKELFGAALPLRDGVFLGSASALSLSHARVVTALSLVRELIGETKRGVAAFWDPDHTPARGPDEWRQLYALGLRGTYLGLETGSPGLRAEIGKSGDLERLLARLRPVQQAGSAGARVRIGVIVLVGVGGAAAVDEHASRTTEIVERMQLGGGDLVFLSPVRGSLDEAALDAVEGALAERLRTATPARVVPYAMDAFRYFA